MRKLYVVFTCIILGITIISVPISSDENTSNIIIVDDDGSADFISIQEAIDYADEGDTIFVYSGTYYGNISIHKSLSIIGEDKYSTIIDGTDIVWAAVITAPNGAVIENFTIKNSRAGVRIGEWNASSKNNIIQNNIISVKINGILVYSSENDIISNNTIMNCNEDGITIRDGSQNIKITGNLIFNCGRDGIWVYTKNIVISGNEIYNNGRNGIMLGYELVDNVRVTNNNIHSNGEHGIYICSSSFPGICSYTIENNIVSNNYYCGIWITGPALNIKIKNNHFQDNGASGVEFDRVLLSSVKQNNFINNGRNAWFDLSLFNLWSNNYWDDWGGIGPKLISGLLNLPSFPITYDLPWINFDWFPAKEPYDL